MNDAYIQRLHLRMKTEAKDADVLRSMGARKDSGRAPPSYGRLPWDWTGYAQAALAA